jgi:hypothetical protein
VEGNRGVESGSDVQISSGTFGLAGRFRVSNRNGKRAAMSSISSVVMEGCDLKTAASKIVEWFGVKTQQEAPGAGASYRNIGVGLLSPDPITEPEHNLADWLTGPQKKTPRQCQRGCRSRTRPPWIIKPSPAKGTERHIQDK